MAKVYAGYGLAGRQIINAGAFIPAQQAPRVKNPHGFIRVVRQLVIRHGDGTRTGFPAARTFFKAVTPPGRALVSDYSMDEPRRALMKSFRIGYRAMSGLCLS
jgi:hypothetical protein